MVWRRVAPVAVVAALGGCGASDDRAQVRGVVERFYEAVRKDRPGDACAQLAASTVQQLESQTGQSCRGVITRLALRGGAITGIHVYVANAKVDLRGGESAFLSRDGVGWRLSALGCRAQEGMPRDRPFDCEVKA